MTREANATSLHELLAARSEAEFQRAVLDDANAYGWDLASHTMFSVMSQGGFPDLVLVRRADKRVVFIELKGPKTRIEPAQQQWIDYLNEAGAEAYIFRPGDHEAVYQVLKPVEKARPR